MRFDRGLFDFNWPLLKDKLYSNKTQKQFSFFGRRFLWPIAVNGFIIGFAIYVGHMYLELTPRYHNYVVQQSYKDRAKTSSIYQGKSQVCGSSTPWLRGFSTLQRLKPSMNFINFSSKRLSSSGFLKCKNLSTNVFNRHFHLKRGTLNEQQRPVRERSRDHNQNNNNKEFNFSNFFLTASAATAFVLVAFGATDVWQGMLNVTRQLTESFQDRHQRFKLTDHFFSQCLIVGTCVSLFLLWTIPSLNPAMIRYATMSKISALPTMLVSAFSHRSLVHIFLNMYVFISFGKAWENYAISTRHIFPKDYMSADKFLAFFCSAGVVASAGSRIVQILGRFSFNSLGASGAVYGLLAYICTKVPDGQLSVVFLPQWTFSARNGMIGLAAFDTIGLLVGIYTGWRRTVFDHAAHLSGLLFGLWYAERGERLLFNWTKYVRSVQEKTFPKR